MDQFGCMSLVIFMNMIFCVFLEFMRYLLMCCFQVSTDFVRLHIDGEIVGEKSLTSLINEDSRTSSLRKITLANIGGHGDGLLGYVHNVKILPPALSIKDHQGKVHCSFSF